MRMSFAFGRGGASSALCKASILSTETRKLRPFVRREASGCERPMSAKTLLLPGVTVGFALVIRRFIA